MVPNSIIAGVAFSPDGEMIASASNNGEVRRWEASTGKPIGQPLIGHTAAAYKVAFSPDGKTIASAGGDGTVRLWDPAIGQPAGALLHASVLNGVSGLAFSQAISSFRLPAAMEFLATISSGLSAISEIGSKSFTMS